MVLDSLRGVAINIGILAKQSSSGIAKHAKVDLIWVAGRSPALVPQNFEMTTLHYLAIAINRSALELMVMNLSYLIEKWGTSSR